MCNKWWALNGLLVNSTNFCFVYIFVMSLSKLGTVVYSSGVAKPGPTRALARASAQLALASKLTKNHVINKIIASTRLVIY